MKKVVSSSIITLLLLLLAAAAFVYFRNFRTSGGDPLKAIPADAAWLHVWRPDTTSFREVLELESWPGLIKAPAAARLYRNIFMFDSLFIHNSEFHEMAASAPFYISAHTTGAGKFDFLFVQSMEGYNESGADLVIKDISGTGSRVIKRNYDGNIIREITMPDGGLFAYTFSKGVFIASHTPFLVEDALRQLRIGKPMVSAWVRKKTGEETLGLLLAMHFSNLAAFTSNFAGSENDGPIRSLKRFAPWAVARVQVFKSGVTLSGTMEPGDSLSNQEIFRGQKPVSKEMMKILPQKTAYVSWMGIDDVAGFHFHTTSRIPDQGAYEKNREFLQSLTSRYKTDIAEQLRGIAGNEIALVITEPAGTDFTNQCFAVVRAKKTDQARSVLKSISNAVNRRNNTNTPEERYNGHSIGLIRLTGVPEAVFGPIFSKVKNMYYTIVGDYFIFANQAASLRLFIDDYSSGRLLHRSGDFTSATHGLPEKGNSFLFFHPASGRYLLKSLMNDSWKELPDTYKDVLKIFSGIAFQLHAGEAENSFMLNLRFGGGKAVQGVLELFTIDTDSAVVMPVHLSADSGQVVKRMVFQDESGALFCVDYAGNVSWKKEIAGKIMGSIHEIDLFRNGAKQFLFNTRDFLYLFDESGRPAGNYPIRLPAPATNGIMVTDFEKGGEAGVFVACQNGKVYAYTVSGRPMPGWVFNLKTAPITNPLKHIRLKGRDGLFLSDASGMAAVVTRYGELMFPPVPDAHPAPHGFVAATSENKLITTDTAGTLIEINFDGSVERTAMPPLDENHGFLYMDVDDDEKPDFLFTDGNELVAYDQERSLLFRVQFEDSLDPEIRSCTMGDGRVLLSVRSVTAGKIWLVRKDGTVYPGFPVPGCGPVTDGTMGEEGAIRLITGGCDHRVHVYSVQ